MCGVAAFIGMGNSAGLSLSFVLGIVIGSIGLCAIQWYLKDSESKIWRYLALSFAILLISWGLLLVLCKPASFTDSCTSCKSNLKNIATGLEAYKTDHGNYPESLDQLIPDYLATEIVCTHQHPNQLARTLYAFQGLSFESYSYTQESGTYFVLSCESGFHTWASTQKGYPKYDSVQGLIDRQTER